MQKQEPIINNFPISIDDNISQYIYKINGKNRKFKIIKNINFIDFISNSKKNPINFTLKINPHSIILVDGEKRFTLFKANSKEFTNSLVPFIDKQDTKKTRKCIAKYMGEMVLNGTRTKTLATLCEFKNKDDAHVLSIILHEKFGLVYFGIEFVDNNQIKTSYIMELDSLKFKGKNNKFQLLKIKKSGPNNPF